MKPVIWIALPLLAALAAQANALEPLEAKKLAERKACFACHELEKGKSPAAPSFRDIAGRYRGDAAAAAMLEKKVREGGKGHWGEAKTMPANVRITVQEAHDLVNWVLAQ